MASSLSDIPSRLQTLHKLYTNPSNDIFLSKNIDQILRFTKSNLDLQHLTRADILAYQEQVEMISRDRERRMIMQKKRHLSTRKWVVWCPRHILLGK